MLDVRSHLKAESVDEMSDTEVEHEIALLEETGRKLIEDKKDLDGDIAALFGMNWYNSIPRRNLLKQLRGIVERYLQRPKSTDPLPDPLIVTRAMPGSPRAQIVTIIQPRTDTTFVDDLRMPSADETAVFESDGTTSVH